MRFGGERSCVEAHVEGADVRGVPVQGGGEEGGVKRLPLCRLGHQSKIICNMYNTRLESNSAFDRVIRKIRRQRRVTWDDRKFPPPGTEATPRLAVSG